MLQVLSLKEGSTERPEKGTSGRIRLPTNVLGDKWWKIYKDGEDNATMRRDGRRGFSGLGIENTRNGDARDGDGSIKLLRSS
uniref:Uncharacterized protein n=1 Tax=Gossypium raimondii TaxID=29730 RepID=A0A0D2RLU4_GOSRA|nr:hypothetical protein B456_005G148800 [Gossypium raimondii]